MPSLIKKYTSRALSVTCLVAETGLCPALHRIGPGMFVPTLSNVGGSNEISSKCILLGVKGFLSKKTWQIHQRNPQGFLKTNR